jgi:hypothetical protein
MSAFSRARVPNITPVQWDRARELFQSEGERIEPAYLRNATGMHIDAAYSLILGIFQEKIADLYWLVYHHHHNCGDGNVAVRNYMDGFQPVPWVCPACEEEVTDESELQYELRAVLRSPVEFTD